MKLLLYPWEQDIKPYFINEEGFEWYVDKFATQHLQRDVAMDAGKSMNGIKDMVAFYVRKGDSIKVVVINKKQEVVAEADTSIGLCCKIDVLKIRRSFNTYAENEEMEEDEHYLRKVFNS